jgi:predicted Zn finger-like uncharacterized protein
MIIECPECETRYETAANIPPEGRKVRCTKCAHIWHAVAIPEPDPDSEAEADIEEDSDESHDNSQEVNSAESEQENQLPFEPDTTTSISPMIPGQDEPEELDFISSDEDLVADEITAAAPETETEDIGFEEEIDNNSIADEPIEAPPSEESPPEENFEEEPLVIEEVEEEAIALEDLEGLTEGLEELDETAQEDISPPLIDEDDEKSELNALLNEGFEDDEEEDQESGIGINSIISDDDEDREEEYKTKRLRAEDTWADYDEKGTESVPISALQRGSFSVQRLDLVAGWAALCLFVICVLGLAVLFRVGVVRTLPATAALYESIGLTVNVRGLEFREVVYSWKKANEKKLLQVEGVIVNITNSSNPVPTVIFAFLDQDGNELYHWAERVRQEPLSSQQSAAFVAKIPAPPEVASSLQVRFAKER